MGDREIAKRRFILEADDAYQQGYRVAETTDNSAVIAGICGVGEIYRVREDGTPYQLTESDIIGNSALIEGELARAKYGTDIRIGHKPVDPVDTLSPEAVSELVRVALEKVGQ